jgi:hypothetical protein
MRYYRKRKVELVRFMGGACFDCGIHYNGKNACIFHFHHVEPHKKEFNIRFANYNKNKIMKELEKCVLLCANCHEMQHSSEF